MKRKRTDEGYQMVRIQPKQQKYKKTTKVKLSKGVSLYTGPEVKYLDTALTTSEFNTTGVIVPINVVPIGTSSSDRIGSKITMSSFYLRVSIEGNSTTTANNLCRIVLVYDKQSNASLPAITSIFNTAESHSQLNKDNRDRYDILMDKVFAVGAQVAASGFAISPSFFSYKKFKKLNCVTQFNQTNGGTYADITTGTLYLVFLGNVATGTTAASAKWTSRVNFSDK